MPISFKSLNKNAKTLFIGICGGSGSGKSHFLEKLVDHFEANEICLISQDNYYKPVGSQKKDAHGMVNFDLPGSFNKASLLQDLKDLLAGKKVYRPKYNFNNPTIPPSMITYKPAPITLIEGIFIFHYTK